MMVTSVAVHDVEIVYLVEVVLGSISGINARYARVETTTQDSCQSSILKTLLVCPLPRVLEVRLILRLVVGCIQIVYSARQTGIHDGEVLVWQGEVDAKFRLELLEERLELFYIISIHLCRADIYLARIVACLDSLCQSVAFLLTTACYHEVGEDIAVLRYLVCCYGGYAASTYHYNSRHILRSYRSCYCFKALACASLFASMAFCLRW